MLVEERLKQLEIAIAKLQKAIEQPPKLKRKIGDAVLLAGKIVEVDDHDGELPYKVEFIIKEPPERFWCAETDFVDEAP